MNPVVLLDEVDKVGSDYRGDPTAALLEVLDPAQNHTFRDHYLEVELDLSDVMFLATANVIDSIPTPLLDRMELVTLDGYTEDEKVAIARDHLLRRRLDRAGPTPEEVRIEDAVLHRLAGEYTREAGVRQLERSIARILRKVTTRLALDQTEVPVHIGPDDLRDYLGRPKHTPEFAERTAVPGVATGLAVTGAGGDVLVVEASLADRETGSTNVTLTGQLGDVMKESAQIALSYLRSHGVELELPVGDLAERGVHVHVLAGAVPKDGPSAGVTRTTALASLPSGRPVRADVVMTGEVSLRTGVANRGREAEVARRASGRDHHRAAASAQRARPGRRAGVRAPGPHRALGRRRPRGARPGPRIGDHRCSRRLISDTATQVRGRQSRTCVEGGLRRTK
jgi:ATP-dependent Lon protease